jgi:hypothetical protein
MFNRTVFLIMVAFLMTLTGCKESANEKSKSQLKTEVTGQTAPPLETPHTTPTNPTNPAKPVTSKIYYVATNGLDTSSGTLDSPFRTINYCASQFSTTGGTCSVRSGTYAENVKVYSNTTISPYEPVAGVYEPVTVTGLTHFAGADLTWTSMGNNIWKANLDLVTNSTRMFAEDQQIFLDNGKIQMTEARWPNIASSNNVLDSTGIEESLTQEGTKMTDGIYGHIVDKQIPKAINLVGGIVHVRGGLNWAAHTGIITEQGADYIKYTADGGGKSGGAALPEDYRVKPLNRYYITRVKDLLDKGDEYFYDQKAKALYLKLATNDLPKNHSIQAKMREYAFVLDNSNNSKLSHLNINAASISMNASSANNLIDYLKVNYVSHYVRALWGSTGFWNNTGLKLWGSNHVLSNSTIEKSAGNGVSVVGDGHKITNNNISFIDYMGVYNAPIFLTPNENGIINNIQILQNTIRNTGRDGIMYLGNGSSPGFYSSRIGLNDISEYGKLARDLGGVYICCNVDGTKRSGTTLISRTVIDHNLVHDSAQTENSSSGIFFDNETHGFVASHNVLWNNRGNGIQLNGYTSTMADDGNRDMTINNNTFYWGQIYAIGVLAQTPTGSRDTWVSNNIFFTETTLRTGCASGICEGKGNFGSWGFSNYYGNPGFVNGSGFPYNFQLANGSSNPASLKATKIWTDTAPVNSLCAGGVATCAQPVAPSFGAYNTGGYMWRAGAQ